jgi:hypothetical protein
MFQKLPFDIFFIGSLALGPAFGAEIVGNQPPSAVNHPHIDLLSWGETQVPIFAEVNIAFRARILNHKVAILNHFSSPPNLLKVDFQYCN